jgi:rhodanese-related sulfurtransferase
MIGRASAADVAAALNRGDMVIDVRTADEYASGHIPGSVFMPLFAVPLRLSELDRRRDVYVVCESGARGQQASRYLDERGYQVRNLDGGMASWRASGMQVRTGSGAGVRA